VLPLRTPSKPALFLSGSDARSLSLMRNIFFSLLAVFLQAFNSELVEQSEVQLICWFLILLNDAYSCAIYHRCSAEMISVIFSTRKLLSDSFYFFARLEILITFARTAAIFVSIQGRIVGLLVFSDFIRP
jgi:hypothetical protein